jgi:hypothetical protein
MSLSADTCQVFLFFQIISMLISKLNDNIFFVSFVAFSALYGSLKHININYF